MSDDLNKKSERGALMSIAIKDKQALYMSFMPFLKGGGLFLPTKKKHELGEEVLLLLTIMDEPTPVHMSGKVVWINPAGAQGNRPRGIGIQFTGENAENTKNLIKAKLGASIALARSTHTM